MTELVKQGTEVILHRAEWEEIGSSAFPGFFSPSFYPPVLQFCLGFACLLSEKCVCVVHTAPPPPVNFDVTESKLSSHSFVELSYVLKHEDNFF